jgi:microcystin-dependent protein
MAGTLFGIAFSQFNDLNGIPQTGAKLHIFAAGTQTPSTAYKDFALTAGQEHPNPIPTDSFGRFPQFWLADGSYSFRVVDRDGVQIIPYTTTTALGASTGDGGGGSAISSELLFQTGDVLWLDVSGLRSGWVRDNGRTIGSATSGAAERASADVEALFTFLWTNFADAVCAVSGGRGATAAADWAANKTIAMPDKRGYVPGGLDDMGNSAASRYTGVPVISGSVTTAGSVIGETAHTLSSSEIPSHIHTITDPGHVHTQQRNTNTGGGEVITVGAASTGGTNQATTTPTLSATTGITATNAAGGGATHNNVQRTVLGTFYRKL